MRRPREAATLRVRLADVLSEARSRAGSGTPALLGIDGPSGSGKSTVAKQLAMLGEAALIEVDDFWTWGDDPERVKDLRPAGVKRLEVPAPAC